MSETKVNYCGPINIALMWVFVLGAYAGSAFVHIELQTHIQKETVALQERVSVLESSILPGMLPETREKFNNLHLHIADLAQRVSLMELGQAKLDAAFERIKPLFIPRKVQTK